MKGEEVGMYGLEYDNVFSTNEIEYYDVVYKGEGFWTDEEGYLSIMIDRVDKRVCVINMPDDFDENIIDELIKDFADELGIGGWEYVNDDTIKG